MRAFEYTEQRDILGIPVKSIGWSAALRELEHAVDGDGGPRFVHFLNANNANIAQRDSAYRRCLSRSIVLPDGIGVDLASLALYGTAFPANLNGTDLVPAFLVRVTRPLRVALIGARPDVLERALERFRALAPWHEFAAISHGYFAPADTGDVLARTAAFRPDVTLVALGSPAQELWIDRHFAPEHGKLVLGVGALFDFVSGTVPRAPEVVRGLRLEWLFRLSREPGRLWRRYVLGNPAFLLRVLRCKLAGWPLKPHAAN